MCDNQIEEKEFPDIMSGIKTITPLLAAKGQNFPDMNVRKIEWTPT
jgi:hypothetical protein